ncbi:protein DMR6-LIKE OXYGENASE 2-like [Andrographis paniculata]|uniref:protein DMR6-LIKE OXYGENASE 2-like n=1 Tax=Andrographis paniculata TaxID=175694 RepID=UPI0021E7AAE9|nr:protein DMR6-LIKE OXYGENASE 2-like [Andrographis paniculata]
MAAAAPPLQASPAFIQAVENRPKPHVPEADGIPTIDLSSTDSAKLAVEIGEACRNWGFFEVINHGVPEQVRRRMESAAREFFRLETPEKKKVSRDEVNPTGYYDTEHTKNVRDWKEVFDFTVQDPTVIPASPDPADDELKVIANRWPEKPPAMRDICRDYGEDMQKLGFKLLELIALSLGLAKDRFNNFFDEQTSFIRINHYPPCPISDLALGVGRHKDGGALTILAQDSVGGLQVRRKSDGEWILVKPNPNTYIINVGDIIQVWSNDKYESVEHRVRVNSEKERFSIPFFLNPAHYIMIEPVEELVNEQNPVKYDAYNWGKFFTSRIFGNYKKLKVDNLQIYHFKKD